jgi:hypothetical protein
MRDAVALPDDRVEIIVEKDTEIGIAGEKLKLLAGTTSAPRYAAYFLVGRRKARMGPHMRTGAE